MRCLSLMDHMRSQRSQQRLLFRLDIPHLMQQRLQRIFMSIIFANDKTKKTLEKNNKSVTETSVGTAGD